MIYIAVFLLASYVLGNALSSLFGKTRDEPFKIFRSYHLYKENQIDFFTLFLSQMINTGIGGLVVGFVWSVISWNLR
jgi:hypothetical protein